MSDSRGFSNRLIKFAGKKIQKGIDYLEAQANTHNYSTQPNPPPPPPPSDPYLPPQSYPQHQPQPQHDTYTQQFYSQAPHPSQQGQHQQPSDSYHSTQFSTAPPPPTRFSEPFSQSVPDPPPTQPQPPQRPSQKPLQNAAGPIITQDLLFHMQARLPAAIPSLGTSPIKEARKGLSRILKPIPTDIDLFATQLKNSDFAAIEPDWNTLDDETPCFALSYVHHQPQGRYKFSDHQWHNLHAVVAAIAHAGVTHFRLWLDQCLWIRDAHQASWAHTGLLPYVLWPVIALGPKLPDADRTVDSYTRMWPFVEQITALWGMGLIIACEYRDKSPGSTVRTWLSYNLRLKTEPGQDVMILLANVFHGAADALETGWEDDKRELKEMAHANIMYNTEQVIIGSDWSSRLESIPPLDTGDAICNIRMPVRYKDWNGNNKDWSGNNVWLDGSRTLKCDGWDGAREWLSGNEIPGRVDGADMVTTYHANKNVSRLNGRAERYTVMTNAAEYKLLLSSASGQLLCLLLAMHVRSSNISRRRVAWTKILTGSGSCNLLNMISANDTSGVERILRQQLNNPQLKIVSVTRPGFGEFTEWV